MNIYNFLNENNIKTSYISKNLKNKKSYEIIRNNYKCKSNNDGIILIGISSDQELNVMKKYKKTVIYWNKFNKMLFNNKTKNILLNKNNNIVHISDDINISNYLFKFGIKSFIFYNYKI